MSDTASGGRFIATHSGSIFTEAARLRDQAVDDSLAKPNMSTFHTVTTMILAAVTCEAFMNDVVELIRTHDQMEARRSTLKAYPKLIELLNLEDEIDVQRGSVALKYQTASIALTGKTFKTGSVPYQDFVTLIRFRNDLVHLHPREKVADKPALEVIPPSYVKPFVDRKMTINVASNSPMIMSWFDQIQTGQMAAWATDTALATVRAILDMTDDGEWSVDPLFPLKLIFRKDDWFKSKLT